MLRPSSNVERAVFVEGGHGAWTAQAAKKLARTGGKRILFACGQTACAHDANKARAALVREKIEVTVVTAPKEGHSYSGKVADLVREQIDWVLSEDARFSD